MPARKDGRNLIEPATRGAIPVERLQVSVFRVPTDLPESDGTLAWNSTTMILVELFSGGYSGVGYTYAGESAACVISEKLAAVIRGKDCMDVPARFAAM